ncbi:MAG: leucyl aminopeptidase, partial [Gammaproteobacteria bacterium]|nr:leucyl aminopeptidase [Gammaproteobacteria bacterium]
MEFPVKSGNPEKQRTACVVVGVHEHRRLSAAASRIDKAARGLLSTLMRRGDMEGKTGQTLLLHNVPHTLCDRVLLVGCGPEREFDAGAYRKVIAQAAKTLNETGAGEAVYYLTELNVRGRDAYWKIRQAVEITTDVLYRFDRLKSKKETPRHALRKIVLNVPGRGELIEGERAVRESVAVASGVKLAKDLGNLPGNICTPTYLADQAKGLAKTYKPIKVHVLGNQDMEKLGMGALLSVARGSREPARLITIEYRGAGDAEKPVALVGKGVTFDSGGISIKPSAAMDEMKFDMCGAASVLGTLSACAELQLPINVVGVIPTTENLPGGNASKPGDIVTSLSGQTIEILNTDAEGRLILCDALTYCARFEPQVVI